MGCMGAKQKDSTSTTVAASERLYVVGLPLDITEDMITAVFSQYGSVGSVKKLANQAGKQDAAALVRMTDIAQAKWLVDNVNQNIPAGLTTPVTITYAEHKGPGGGGAVPPPPQTVPPPMDGFGKALATQPLAIDQGPY